MRNPFPFLYIMTSLFFPSTPHSQSLHILKNFSSFSSLSSLLLASSLPSFYSTQQASESRDQPYSRQNGEYDPSGVTLQSGAIMPPTNNGRSGLQTPISDQPQSRSANPQQQMHVGNSEYQQRQLEGDNGEYAEPRRGGNKLLNFLMCRCG